MEFDEEEREEKKENGKVEGDEEGRQREHRKERKEDEKEFQTGEKFEEGGEKDREGERKVIWKAESEDDVEGGQQERRKVVENVMNWLREKKKERRKCEAEVVQGNESDDQKVDKDVMGKIEGMVKIPNILWDFVQSEERVTSRRMQQIWNTQEKYETVQMGARSR